MADVRSAGIGEPEPTDLVGRLAGDGDGSTPTGLLRGRYELLEVLGQGGEGEVLRAWDHQHDRPVALKVRPIGPATERDRVLEEARTLLSLRPHENVATVRDDFFDGDNYYLVLDWVPGEDLRARLRRDGSPGLPFPVVLEAVRDVAAALDHLHGHAPPVVHGDVKPANIVVATTPGDDPRAVLVDFGLAGVVGQDGSTAATEAYASPELCQGQPATPSSDVYALAATAFELITGRVPLPGATLDWSGVPADARPGVRESLARGLASDPAHRPASAGELVTGLSPGSPPSDRRRRELLATVRGRRRGAVLRFGAALVVAAAAGSIGAALVVDEDNAPSAPPADPFPIETLPPDSERVGQLAVLITDTEATNTLGGVFETQLLGHDGATARTRRDTGLTATWSHMVSITPDLVLFYREADQYAVVVRWESDGHALDLFAPPALGTGWSHIVPLGADRFITYEHAGGTAQLVTHDEGLVVSQVPVAGLPPGRTHLVPLDGERVLSYDSGSGAGEVVRLGADGSVTPEAPVDLGAGWATVAPAGDGRVLLGAEAEGDGAASVRLLGLADPAAPAVLDEAEVDQVWQVALAVAPGRVLLYDRDSGTGRVLELVDGSIEVGPALELAEAGTLAIARP